MATEARTQANIIKFLKKKGCYVIKTRPGPGVPVGCPDIIFLKEGFWGALECKRSSSAPYQKLQPETLAKLSGWSYARVIHPDNEQEIMEELDVLL